VTEIQTVVHGARGGSPAAEGEPVNQAAEYNSVVRNVMEYSSRHSMRHGVYAGRFGGRGVISAAGAIASLAFTLPARAESRKHDGFYAAANVGVGYSKESDDDDRLFALPISLWSGYTYGKVAFGGGLNWNLYLYSVALFADIYPDPKSGFHIMPSFGWGVLFPHPRFPNGPVFAGGVGYDFWVGPEVSMGVMGRLTYAPLHDYERDTAYRFHELALLYTVTYQ
jgi:hypothetical protein